MNGVRGWESDCGVADYVEIDPTGRYGRYSQVLGKGASKIVYKAFDEYEGIEVAWNQVKLTDFLQKPEDLERLYSEIHLLKTLKHSNIMKFYASWVDISNRNINFVTEMFTSGTLRQYRLKHKKVNIRAVKHWCRQILKGLLYLHSLDPPVIHRDLKCDNIFINGNQGQVKIGDLGLAAILRQSHAASCVVGTPEFMAPEIYAEEYNELVDIYSFGMCVLEMVTFEYPYSECTHPAQIYKKVISGKRPESLYKVKDQEVRQFVEKCLATVSSRLPARELLKDPFLQTDGGKGYDLRPIDYQRDYEETTVPLVREVSFSTDIHQRDGSLLSSCSDYDASYYEHDYDVLECEADQGIVRSGRDIDFPVSPDHDHVFSSPNAEITIKGTRKDDGDVFLRLRISDREGRVRNIYFPFDLENDTALCVANEMVAELDITEQYATSIADIIDGEIASLVPDWQQKDHVTGNTTEEQEVEEEEPELLQKVSSPAVNNVAANGKHHRHSGSYLADYVLPENRFVQDVQVLHCSGHAPSSSRGRFEEVTYQVESSAHDEVLGKVDKEEPNPPLAASPSSQSVGRQFTDVMALHDDVCESFKRLSFKKNDRLIIDMDVETPRKDHLNPRTPYNSPATSMAGPDYENEIRKELRWLKAKYQMQLRELRDEQLMAFPGFKEEQQQQEDSPATADIVQCGTKKIKNGSRMRKKFSMFLAPGFHHDRNPRDAQSFRSPSGESSLAGSKSIYNESLLPHSLHRATSLPVDAVDC